MCRVVREGAQLPPEHLAAGVTRERLDELDRPRHRRAALRAHEKLADAIEVGDAATATADSYWLFWRDTATSPVLHNMGHYHDVLRREDGAWRIARRVITLG